MTNVKFWTWSLVALGLALRSVHFFRGPSVWHDEAALLLNVDLTFAEMLGPLRHHEAAPPLFLMLERLVYLCGGDSEWALRLPAFLASCATVILKVPVARALVPAVVVPVAVGLIAGSEMLCWHSCEAKPYAVDALVALGLIAVGVLVRCERRQFWIYSLTAPALIWLSYPACFAFGGVILALARRANIKRLSLLTLIVMTSFVLLAWGPAKAQRDNAMDSCWTNYFPDYSRPASVPLWSLLAFTEVTRYAFKPLGQLLFALVPVGAVVLGRRNSVLLLAPVGLAFIAACLHRYPFGGARVMVFAAPALALAIAAGVAPAWAWLQRRSAVAPFALTGLLLIPVGAGLYRVFDPWPRPDTKSACQLVINELQPGELVIGNDWTHEYYLRHLGEKFQLESSDFNTQAVWVIFTDVTKAEVRFLEASRRVPSGWTATRRAEFAFTTVARFER